MVASHCAGAGAVVWHRPATMPAPRHPPADDPPLPPGPQIGDTIEIDIHELGHGGVGVGRHASGLVCLVPRTLPGEQVVATVRQRQARLAHAQLVRVERAAPQRVPAPCTIFDRCGGCHLQHLGYGDQLAAKREVLVRTLARALGPIDELVAPVVASPAALGYRNRTLYHVEGRRIGFVDPVAERVVEVDECAVSEPANAIVLAAVRAWLVGEGAALAPAVCDVLVRTGRDGVTCVLVVAEEDLAAKLTRRWSAGTEVRQLAPLRALANALAPAGLWLNHKPRHAKAVFGDDFVHVAGPLRVVERVGPFALDLSPGSFAQANPAIAGLLYARLVDMLGPTEQDSVLDLFSGSGALAFHLAQRAGHVDAVELSATSRQDAAASAVRNGIANVTWHAGKCEDLARTLRERGARYRVASVNPPRTGLHESLPALLGGLGVARLAYVSCAPPTLARDLVRLRAQGFAVVQVVPFDMFAQTHHVETLTLLVRGSSEPQAAGQATGLPRTNSS